jgi:uncharacterized protein (TIGR00255 family)
MIKSMTGFGKQNIFVSEKAIQIEIRSVNSKSFDFMSRMPAHFREKEPEIRRMIQQILHRGKIEININENAGESTSVKINQQALKAHYLSMQSLAHDLGLKNSEDWLGALLRIPDVLVSNEEELDEKTWTLIFEGIEQAALSLDEFRRKEGAVLAEDFTNRIHQIKRMQEEIPAFEEERIVQLKARFEKNLSEVIDNSKMDENRLEQEIIYYLEKLDITEEKVRLAQHLDYFMETLNSGESQGKKLNFISQEIGRELNTLGSKANHAQIQRFIVQMKDELEKIKEQLLNIL